MSLYSQLHLENVEIPDYYMGSVLESGEWIYDELDAFNLTISEVSEGICYALDLAPFHDESKDMYELNESLEKAGYEANGYGWEDYLCEFIDLSHPNFSDSFDTDSEYEVCGIYVIDSLGDYKQLLLFVSEAIRYLLSLFPQH
jgi:hypothetical protein